MAVARHFPQPWFDIQESGRQPALALTRVLPVVDLRTAFLDERIDRLEAAGCLQRPPQYPKQAEAMERHGLLQAFGQTTGC